MIVRVSWPAMRLSDGRASLGAFFVISTLICGVLGAAFLLFWLLGI